MAAAHSRISRPFARRALAVVVVAAAASCGGYGITDPVTVARVDIAAARLTVTVGDSLQLYATAYDAHGRKVSPKVLVGWASSAPAVAVANAATGAVVGIAPGSATIAAVARGKRGTVVVTVVAAPASLQRVRGPVVRLDTASSQFTRLLVQAAPPGAWSGQIWLLVDGRTAVLAEPGRPASPRAVVPGTVVRASISTGILTSDPEAARADTLAIEPGP